MQRNAVKVEVLIDPLRDGWLVWSWAIYSHMWLTKYSVCQLWKPHSVVKYVLFKKLSKLSVKANTWCSRTWLVQVGISVDTVMNNTYFVLIFLQILNHLHKKLRNMSKKSEASKKKVIWISSDYFLLLFFLLLFTSISRKVI